MQLHGSYKVMTHGCGPRGKLWLNNIAVCHEPNFTPQPRLKSGFLRLPGESCAGGGKTRALFSRLHWENPGHAGLETYVVKCQ